MSAPRPAPLAPAPIPAAGPPPRIPTIPGTAFALTAVRLSLLLLGFARTHAWIAAAGRRGRRSVPLATRESATVHAAASRVAAVAAFFPGRALCLEQSLTLHWLLGRRGIRSTLRLGVQPFPFTAHAWVEHDGAPVNETHDGMKGIVPFPALPERLP